jgi:hypothetical protein
VFPVSARAVESPSVSPFSEGALVRGSGTSIVAFLRNMSSSTVNWKGMGGKIILEKGSKIDFEKFLNLITQRLKLQKQNDQRIVEYFQSQYERWNSIARELAPSKLDFVEYYWKQPKKHVVLGDTAHEYYSDKLKVVFKNAPQSLREIEETTGFVI